MQGRFRARWHAAVCVMTLSALALAACQKPTELIFRVDEPTSPLLDPFSLPVSDYVLKYDDGTTLAAISAGAGRDDEGRLQVGALDPALAGDLRLDVLSGAQLIGSSRLRQVAIDGGHTTTLTAYVRKPLSVVGTARAPEGAGPAADAMLVDPTTATDLARRGIDVPESAAAAFTSDGRALVLAGPAGLTVIDTGTGAATGPMALPFTPALMALAPHDAGLALLERASGGSRVLLYPDVAALVGSPAAAQPVTATVSGGLPRAARFSPDGAVLYVLTEDAGAEPCTGPAPPANQIVPVERGGAVDAPIPLPSYVADLAVDRGGRLILAQAGADSIGVLTLSAAAGPAAGPPTKLYDATCPTGLRLLEDQVFAVTNDSSKLVPDAFTLLRGRLDGSDPTRLPITRPSYVTQLNKTSTRDKLTHLNLQFVSVGIAATEMAVSPDGNRALIATRARYYENTTTPFDFVGLQCTAMVDIVEYGLFSVDLVAGTASYTSRSQNTVVPADPLNDACVSCEADLGGFPPVVITLDLLCPSTPGDRAAGLSAAFSGAP